MIDCALRSASGASPRKATLSQWRAGRIGRVGLFALLVCTTMLALPGCSGTKPTRAQTIARYSQELRDAVSTNVADPGRKAQSLQIVDQVEALHLRFSQETAEFVERYRQLNADYDATRPAFDRLFSEYNAKRIQARQDALDLHFQLASLAVPREWDPIGRAETRLYEEANAARASGASTK